MPLCFSHKYITYLRTQNLLVAPLRRPRLLLGLQAIYENCQLSTSGEAEESEENCMILYHYCLHAHKLCMRSYACTLHALDFFAA